LARSLGVPFVAALVRTSEAPEQKLMANSSMQARNVAGTLGTIEQIPAGAVLLIDDIIGLGLDVDAWPDGCLERKAAAWFIRLPWLARRRARLNHETQQ